MLYSFYSLVACLWLFDCEFSGLVSSSCSCVFCVHFVVVWRSSIASAVSILLMLIAFDWGTLLMLHRCSGSRIWLSSYFCFDIYTTVGFVLLIIILVVLCFYDANEGLYMYLCAYDWNDWNDSDVVKYINDIKFYICDKCCNLCKLYDINWLYI